MLTTKFTPEQILQALRRAESRTRVGAICRMPDAATTVVARGSPAAECPALRPGGCRSATCRRRLRSVFYPMLLTITTHLLATDLGYLLHKCPARIQSANLSFGRAHVSYPKAGDDCCTAALLLGVDPVGREPLRRVHECVFGVLALERARRPAAVGAGSVAGPLPPSLA